MRFQQVLPLFLCVFLFSCASIGEGTIAEKRAHIQTMKENVLTQLFESKPDTKAQIKAAPGYAVFSNANVNLIFMAAGTGYGVVVDKKSGKQTYMNMAEGGIGLGLGVKDYRIVMVFHTKSAMRSFIDNGWTVGGNADATLKAGDKGGSIEGEGYYGDITVYTFTESGAALQATIKGTKFWPDTNLN